ncbi:RDD family protein [Cellulosimicrobium cellulans]|uniref:RDD family protein n=1 Tax=Cellulosimicrobium cellulans TaxID=1710 RepID=UPI0024050862|nr:RDD family protein [Cellulosimicrobium cellulans]MDF9877821.1 Mce-associated membrane protein [Cellulosimicrobium cellulans]
MAIDAPTGRGPTHAVGAGDLEPALPGLGPEPTREEYASWSRRVVASLLDTAIVATVLFLAVGPAYEVAWLPGISFGVTASTVVPGGTWWALGTAAALFALQGWTGATPGKRTVGIVVVHDATGRPAGLIRTVLRHVAHLLDAILYIGFLRPLWHAQRRTFADSVCSTVVLRQVRPPVPFLGPGTGLGGPTPSRTVTAVATVLSVGSAVFVLGPASYTGGDVWTATCTPEVSDESPLTVGDVRVVGWSTPGTESRWGVTRTSPLPDEAGDETGLDASFPVDLDLDATLDQPLDAALVLRLETWQGDDLGTFESPFRVEQHPDGGSEWEVVPPTPAGSGLDGIHVPAATVAALPAAWGWEASVEVEGETVASCGDRGPS